MSGRRVRVAVDASALRDGRARAGIGRYVGRLVPELRRRPGLDVVAASPPWPPRPDAWASRWANAQPWLLAAAAGRRADVVHATGSDPAAAWPLARQVVTVHDVVPWRPEAERWRRHPATDRWFAWQAGRIARCGAVLVPSRATAEEVVAVLGVSRARLHVVAEGVGAPFTVTPGGDDAALRERAGVPPGRYLLWTGNLAVWDARKALGLLVEAVAAIPESPPLVCTGTGAGGDRLGEVAAARGVRLHRSGHVDDATLAALYRGAAAFVLPSLHEGFGLPLLEAMACGAPCVVSDGGNLPDLAGDAAVVVGRGDAGALAGALRRVLDDGVLAMRLRGDGPRRAARFGWDRAAAATEAVYRTVVE